MISITYIEDRVAPNKQSNSTLFPLCFINGIGIRNNAMNLCECGCGQKCNIRFVKGHHCRFGLKKTDGFGTTNNRHPLYKVWNNMTQRCYNPNKVGYKNWGGRGITICDEWKNDSGAFIKWCLENGWTKGLEIDRIDNDGNYEPQNIRFVTHRENNLNNRHLISTNTSGYRGISYMKKLNKYQSYIDVKGKRVPLGRYETLKRAVDARNCFIIKNNLESEYAIQTY